MFKPKVNIELNKKIDENVFQLKQPSALKTVLLAARKDENDRAANGVIDNIMNQVLSTLQHKECSSFLNTFLT